MDPNFLPKIPASLLGGGEGGREREKKGRKNLVEFQLDPIERQDDNFFSDWKILDEIGGVISAFFQAKTRIKSTPSCPLSSFVDGQ